LSLNTQQLKIRHLRYEDKTQDRKFLIYVTDSNYFSYVEYWLFYIFIDYISVRNTRLYGAMSYFVLDVIFISEWANFGENYCTQVPTRPTYLLYMINVLCLQSVNRFMHVQPDRTIVKIFCPSNSFVFLNKNYFYT